MRDGLLLSEARREAFDVVETDPDFNNPEHKVIDRAYQRSYSNKVLLIDVG